MRPLSNPFRLFDISALLGIGTDTPFRLLHLPREIRDMIYHAILCDWGVPGRIRHRLTDDRKALELEVMTNKAETTNILLVSKQVYEEAKQVFLKGNQFIHISMSARNPYLIAGAFCDLNVPIVESGRENVVRFKDIVVMKHEIGFPGDNTSSRRAGIDIIMLKRDLSAFVSRIALIDTHTRHIVGQSRHEMTIFNPFVKTPSPNFLNVKNLERLLEPYLRRLKGFDDFQVKGEIDPGFAKSVVAMIRLEPPLPSPPSKIVDRIIAWQSRGDQSFLEKNYIRAQLYWDAAHTYMLSMRNRRAWPTLMETAGKEFTDHLSNAAVEVESSRVRVCLYMCEADLEGGNVTGASMDWISSITKACSDALDIGVTLGTGWETSDDQMATIFYYWAKVHRVAGGDVHFAEDTIRRADHLRPDDEEIGSEMEKIVEWKHSMGLP